jgi:hypothetical protein
MPTAHRLARCYQRHVAALRAAAAFDAWLDGFWRPSGPPEPAGAPTAVSWVAGDRPAVRWHAAGPVVRGYVLGRTSGCYEVPAGAVPPESAPATAVVFAA